MMEETGKAGFVYTIETLDAEGTVIDTEVVKNLIPVEGLNYMLGASLTGVTPQTSWYVGLFKGNYTPLNTDTAAGFAAASTEFTDYTGNRPVFSASAPAGGALTNAAAKAEITFTTDTTVYGGFICSAAGKGATSGVLISAVRFASPKAPGIGGLLRITAGLTLFSA